MKACATFSSTTAKPVSSFLPPDGFHEVRFEVADWECVGVEFWKEVWGDIGLMRPLARTVVGKMFTRTIAGEAMVVQRDLGHQSVGGLVCVKREFTVVGRHMRLERFML